MDSRPDYFLAEEVEELAAPRHTMEWTFKQDELLPTAFQQEIEI